MRMETHVDASTLQLTVRYFAAARAAAGAETENVRVEPGTTVASSSTPSPSAVQSSPGCCDDARSSVTEIAVRDEATELSDGQIIDVLPPFAGG